MIRKKTLYIGLFFTLFFSLFYLFYSNKKINFFEYFELKTYDIRYKIRGKKNKNFDVVIVGIDEKSLLKIGKWPWKRDIHAKLISKLNKMGAKSIGFDISFTEEAVSKDLYNYRENLKQNVYENYKLGKLDRDVTREILQEIAKLKLDEDYIFAEEIKNAENIVIGTYNIKNKTDIKEIENISLENYYLKSRYYNIKGVLEKHIEYKKFGIKSFNPEMVYKIIPPIDIIAKNSFGTAPYEIGEPYVDGVCRGLPITTYEEYSDFYFPPLYILVFLSANNLNIKDNVILNIEKSYLAIYKDVEKKELLLKMPTDKNGYQILNFYGKHNSFEYISYIDILNDEVDESKIKDKIIMVGYTDTAKGLYDLRSTPFDSITPGVAVHATAIQNMIDANSIIRWETWQNFFIVIIFCILITFLLSAKKINMLLENLISAILIILYTFFSYYMFSVKNIWIDLFYPLVSFSFIYFILLLINYLTEGLEKKKIKSAFEHYTSRELIEKVLNNPKMLKLGGERKEVTAFFSDIANFTSISENMDPEYLIEILNEYLGIMTKIIIKHNGYIDKYEGDAIMASFGAFGYLENHAELACKTAIEYQKELEKLREKWKKEKKPEIHVRIGINTGEVIAGNMGSDERFDYTIIGDEVNLASRLESANKQYGTYIMISENTYERVMDKYFVRQLDSIRVKGKKNAVNVFELIEEKENIDEYTENIVSLNKMGIHFYKMMEWEKSKEYFEEILKIKKDDIVAQMYIKRCIFFKNNPPDKDWDGVYTMETK